MARLKRVLPINYAIHVLIRSNNRQACFNSSVDYSVYLWWLREYSEKYLVDIHAWVLLENHIHLLCTQKVEGGLSRMIQAIGRQYVRFFNQQNKRTGTLWEGRFRSCIVQSENYLLEVYKYIEMNPVRLELTGQASEYKWSSYLINANGKSSALCKPHDQYLSLGDTKEERSENYRLFCKGKNSEETINEIRKSTNKGLAIGEETFKVSIEKQTGYRFRPLKKGRPIGWRKNKNL